MFFMIVILSFRAILSSVSEVISFLHSVLKRQFFGCLKRVIRLNLFNLQFHFSQSRVLFLGNHVQSSYYYYFFYLFFFFFLTSTASSGVHILLCLYPICRVLPSGGNCRLFTCFLIVYSFLEPSVGI